MRFRFCGDLDCPDWILAEINTLARMSSVKMKLLAQQVARSLLCEEMDYDKVKKLTSDAKFDPRDVKASVAALAFVLRSSARHGVDEDVLSSELQQLGLPREHAGGLVRVYSDNVAALTAGLRAGSLRLTRLEDVTWHVQVSSVGEPVRAEVHLGLRVWDSVEGRRQVHHMVLPREQLGCLLGDLKKVSHIMEPL